MGYWKLFKISNKQTRATSFDFVQGVLLLIFTLNMQITSLVFLLLTLNVPPGKLA